MIAAEFQLTQDDCSFSFIALFFRVFGHFAGGFDLSISISLVRADWLDGTGGCRVYERMLMSQFPAVLEPIPKNRSSVAAFAPSGRSA